MVVLKADLKHFSVVNYFLLPFTEEDEGTNDRTLMYYVNDGVYGSFNCILYDHAHCLPILHKVCVMVRYKFKNWNGNKVCQ